MKAKKKEGDGLPKVPYGSKEYEQAYNEGRVVGQTLPEVDVVRSGVTGMDNPVAQAVRSGTDRAARAMYDTAKVAGYAVPYTRPVMPTLELAEEVTRKMSMGEDFDAGDVFDAAVVMFGAKKIKHGSTAAKKMYKGIRRGQDEVTKTEREFAEARMAENKTDS